MAQAKKKGSAVAAPKAARLVMWTARWCGPCQAMKKAGTPEKVASELGVPLQMRDIEVDKWTSSALHVRAIPTFETFTQDGEPIAQFEGAAQARIIVAALTSEKGRAASRRARKA